LPLHCAPSARMMGPGHDAQFSVVRMPTRTLMLAAERLREHGSSLRAKGGAGVRAVFRGGDAPCPGDAGVFDCYPTGSPIWLVAAGSGPGGAGGGAGRAARAIANAGGVAGQRRRAAEYLVGGPAVCPHEPRDWAYQWTGSRRASGGRRPHAGPERPVAPAGLRPTGTFFAQHGRGKAHGRSGRIRCPFGPARRPAGCGRRRQCKPQPRRDRGRGPFSQAG